MTRYTKPALTFDEQVDRLLRRGMIGDREAIKSRLSTVNYYRLSAYWYPFRKHGATPTDRRLDDFVEGTAFDTIWDRYIFDQKLRLIVMEAIERIEVAARTQIAYTHAHAWTPDAYASNPASLPRLIGGSDGPPSHARFLTCYIVKLREELCCSEAIGYFERLSSPRASADVPHPETPCSCETHWTIQ